MALKNLTEVLNAEDLPTIIAIIQNSYLSGIKALELGANVDLDTIITSGLHSQSANVEATVALHYPIAAAGLLEVFTYATMIHQRYWKYQSSDVYYRAKYSTSAWTAWMKMPTSLSDLGITATVTELNYIDGVTSAIQTQLNAKAPLASPALTDTPTAPTATAGDNTTKIATTAFVLANSINNLSEDTTPELGGALDFLYYTLNKSAYRQIADAAPATGTTHTFDYANGDMQQITCPAGGTLTLAFSNLPASKLSGFIVDIVNGGNCTVNLPTGMFYDNKTAPIFTVAGIDRFIVMKDKDAVLTLKMIAQNIGVPA